MLSLLEDEDKIRSSPFTASYLRSKTWHAASSATTRSIADYFWTDHTIQIVRNPNLIREAIVNGVKNENWVYYDAGTGKTFTASTMAGFSPEMKPDAEVMTASEAQSRGLLIRKPTQTDLRAVITNDDLTGAEIRSRLEAQCGGEPTKTDVLELLATAVQASDYKWFVVLDAEPAPGVRALSPSAIRTRDSTGCASSAEKQPTRRRSRCRPALRTRRPSMQPAQAVLQCRASSIRFRTSRSRR